MKIKQTKNKKGNFKDKLRTSFNNQKQYKIFGSKQFIGMMFIIIFSYLFIVSIVQVPGFSTINSYTIGMLFGYYSYFIYVGFIWYGLTLLFNLDIKFEKFIARKFKWKLNFSWIIYLTLIIGIALVTESIIQIVKNKTSFPGISVFNYFFNDWWNSFTSSTSGASLPDVSHNSGIIIALFVSLIASWAGFPVSIVLGIVLVGYFVFYLIYGSLWKIIKTKIRNSANQHQKVKSNEFKEYDTKILDLSFEDNNVISSDNIQENDKMNIKLQTTTVSIQDPQDIFPIEDPFDDTKEANFDDFIKEKTKEYNVNYKKTTELDFKRAPMNIEIADSQDKSMEFELDIFNTNTSRINPNKFKEDEGEK